MLLGRGILGERKKIRNSGCLLNQEGLFLRKRTNANPDPQRTFQSDRVSYKSNGQGNRFCTKWKVEWIKSFIYTFLRLQPGNAQRNVEAKH